MKINALSGNVSPSKNNLNFGHIYSNAVDKIRKNNDNYFKEYYYDAFDDYRETPYIREGYYCTEGKDSFELMSNEEVSRLGELVDRASKLTKSIIAGTRFDQLKLFIMSDGERIVADKIQLKQDDKENNFKEFEKLIEKAEEHENNPNATDIEPVVAKERYDRLDKQKAEPRYNEIYAQTICNDGCIEY